MLLKRLVLVVVRFIFKRARYNTLDVATTRSSTRNIRDAIVALDDINIKPADKIDRVYAPNVSPDEFKKKIEEEFKTAVDVIEPGGEGSKSSKFYTFKFKVGDKVESIVLAKGIIAGEEGEKKQEVFINDQIRQAGSITLEVVGMDGRCCTVNNVVGFTRITGNKKADFVFAGDENLYVQHKSPSHQQMSGTARFSREEYPELNTFIKEVAEAVKSTPSERLEKPMLQSIESDELKRLAIYGDQDGTSNGVQVYAIGDLALEGEGKVRRLTARGLYLFDEIPSEDDAPVLGATYRLDRNQYGIPNVRFGIYPASYFKGVKS